MNLPTRRKSIDWVHDHAVWAAVSVLALGAFGYGYCLCAVQARADRAVEIATLSDGYRAALDAKDKLINQLAGSAVIATGQAADAAATASQAADTAAKAASTAAAATAVKVKQ